MTTEKDMMDITEEMEKDIEKRYRNLIEEEKPNLWDRIEKEIDQIEDTAQETTGSDQQEKKELKGKRTELWKYLKSAFQKGKVYALKGSPVREAALLTCCCLLIIGVFGGTSLNQKMNASSPVPYENQKQVAMNMYMEDTVEYEGAEALYNEESFEELQASASSGEMSEVTEVQDTDRKLIRTINLTVQTLKFDELFSSIQTQVKALGGYIENSSVDGSPYFEENTRYANITLRIPQEQTDAFLTDLSGEATITHRSESIEDITLTYVDLESHIKALQTEENTLLELMKKAENLEDILAIQSELSNIRYQLDSYKSQLKTYDNQVSYDTVTIYMEEVKEIEPAKEPNFFQRLANRFTDGIESVFYGVQDFIITIVGFIPFTLFLFAVSFVVIKIIKSVRKKKR